MIPLCIDDYNRHMGGVDTADQLRCYYDLQLISWRTWWPMLFWAYDTMVGNAFIIFKSMPQTPELEHKQFRLQCAWGLINAWGGPKNKKTRCQETPPRPAPGGTELKGTELPPGRVTDTSHFPQHLGEGQRGVCWLCRWKEKGKGSSQNLPKTCWVCVKCDKPLCQKEERNCFVEFHSP
jgi:hypothetical protein